MAITDTPTLIPGTNTYQTTGGVSGVKSAQNPYGLIDYTGQDTKAPTDTTASKGTITAPSTVYSGNVQNNRIPDLNNKLNQYSNTGTQTGTDGKQTYSNGTAVQPETSYMYDKETGGKVPVPQGKSVADFPNYSPVPIAFDTNGTATVDNTGEDAYQSVVDSNNQKIASIKAGTDPQTASMIDAIHQQYEVLRQQQTQADTNSQASLTQGLITGGAARYGRGTAVEGLVNNTVSFGLSQIQSLNAQEQSAIAKAKQAQIDQDYPMMKTALDHAEQIRSEKVAQAQKISDKLEAENTKQREATMLAQTDASIAKLYEGGMTNASDIQQELQKAGYTTTLKEVSDSLNYMQENKSITDLKQTAVENGDVPPEILNKEYKNTSEAIAALAPYIRKGNNELTKVGEMTYLIDKNTGKIVKSYGVPASTTGGVGSTSSDYSTFTLGMPSAQSDAFNSIPDNDKTAVMQLVNGDALISDLVKSRGVAGTAEINRLISEAQKVDPNFSINTNKIRYSFLQSWNNPNQGTGKTRNSINTALGHLADFKLNADALDAGTIKKLNNVQNILSTETGDAKVLKLRTDINALASEIATIYKGGQPTEKEIQSWETTIAADFSKNQFKGVSEEITKLLSSKITATRYQYKNTMGKEYDQSLIDPDKKQALLDVGINPDVFAKENVPKVSAGTVPDTQAVDILLKRQGLTYDKVLNTLTSQRKAGEVMVLDRKTGQAGTIPEGEFDNSLYVKL